MTPHLSRAEAALFGIGLVSLMYELTQVRLLAFFLGNNMDFLAIPIALVGLAGGSIWCHFFYRGTTDKMLRVGLTAVLPLMVTVLLALFYIANTWWNDIHVSLAHPYRDGIRLVVYSLLFLPPYFAFGAMLSSLFGDAGDRIGRYYFFDLAGAAVGCIITPLMFTYTDLQPVLLTMLALAAGLALIPEEGRWGRFAFVGTLLAGVAVAAMAGVALVDRPDPNVLGRYLSRNRDLRTDIHEVDVQWNEIARASLMRAGKPKSPKVAWAIVQDNGLSNATVAVYDPEHGRDFYMRSSVHHSLPWKLGREPKSVLVMFAGLGRDLIAFNALTEGGRAVGVEINSAVVDFHRHPALQKYNLAAFHALPNVDLITREGRDFLNNSVETFDMIYVANNGAVQAARTGHTRKFLDTCEAMEAYLDHLAPGGMMVFTNQPIEEKVSCFRDLLAERGLADVADALVIFGRPNRYTTESMVFAPDGLSDDEIAALERVMKNRLDDHIILLGRGHQGDERLTKRLSASTDDAPRVTDDRPFQQSIKPSNFTLRPTESELNDAAFVSSWVKIFSVVFFTFVSAVVGVAAVALGGREQRVPLPWMAYFGTAGVAYMCVQIGLIAKTELFIGNPLYAVAVNLAAFLIFNAVGALTQDRFRERNHPGLLAIVTLLAIVWGVVVAGYCGTYLLSAPFILKIVGVAVTVLPPGVALGAWYPFGVHALVSSDRAEAVPITYALSTLSSVLGSAFAMTAIINLGFTTVIALGAVGYAIAGLIAWGALSRSGR